MKNKQMQRRDFIKMLSAAMPMLAFSWNSFPVGGKHKLKNNEYDAIIIGAGLGGLSCAAAFARQGFKPLVLEQHSIPGGYATTFKRKDFVFDVSLHSTTVEERNGIYNLIPEFPEITDVEFVPHPHLFRAVFPEHDLRVPQQDAQGYIRLLQQQFPEERQGISDLFTEMKGVQTDINKLSAAKGKINMERFPVEFPHLVRNFNATWGELVNRYIQGKKLKAVVSAQWGYYGLPPSQLASIYYALPFMGYLEGGGYYPRGRSQKMSNAFVNFIESRGGTVQLRTRVQQIRVKNGRAIGVTTADGRRYKAKVVVSNANGYDTFHKLLDPAVVSQSYLSEMDNFSPSLSSFQVWLGLKENLVEKLGLTDSEIFYDTGYDPEAGYRQALTADVESNGFGLTLYDNIYQGYSPAGKNTVGIIALQGYDHWEVYEADYFRGNKSAYRKEKQRMADILINQVEQTFLPGLRQAIEVQEIGTPLTNVRYTGNYKGAIYGWNQTLENAMPRRVPHATPVENLYLAGAWTQPGGGYAAVIPSGLNCFKEIMNSWQY